MLMIMVAMLTLSRFISLLLLWALRMVKALVLKLRTCSNTSPGGCDGDDGTLQILGEAKKQSSNDDASSFSASFSFHL